MPEAEVDVESPIARLDEVVIFGSPRMWVGLLGVISLLAAGLVWGLFAQPPVAVSARGVLSTVGGPLEIGTSQSGTVTKLNVVLGESVQEFNSLAVVRDDRGNSIRLLTPVAGTVIEISTQVGDFVSAGETVAIIQDSREQLQAIALVPVSSVGSIEVGQEVQVSADSVPVGEYGYLKGRVESIATVPMSLARVNQLVGSVAGYQDVNTLSEPIVEVRVSLVLDTETTSGFSWTIGRGPSFALLAGTPWRGDVITGFESPLTTLFGS